MGGAHQALVTLAHRLQESLLSLGIQFRQHVVEQQKGRLPQHLPHQLQFRQFQGQHQRALLAGRGVAPGCLARQHQLHVVALGPHRALAQPQFLGPLAGQLGGQGFPPGGLVGLVSSRLSAGLPRGVAQGGATAVVEFQHLPAAPQLPLPLLGQGFQAPQGPGPPPVQSGAHHGHLEVKGVEQAGQGRSIELATGVATQQLAPLAQQASIAAEQFAVEGLELHYHSIEPMAPQGWLTSHQLQIQGAEADAAQRGQQVQLALQGLAVALGTAATAAAQFQLQ